MAPTLAADELVRLSVDDKWLLTCFAHDGEKHNIRAVSREHLPDKDQSLSGTEGVCWENTGFIVRLEGTSDSGEQQVRLDAARFVDSFLFVDKPDAGWMDGEAPPLPDEAPLFVLNKASMKEEKLWEYGVFIVEATGGAAIRLRSQAVPDRYVVVSSNKSDEVAKQKRHHVFAMAMEQEATAFEVTHEGVEAAKVAEGEARKDLGLNKSYDRLFKAVFNEAIGIYGTVVSLTSTCPAIDGIVPVFVTSGIVNAAMPLLSLILVMVAEKEVRENEGKVPPWVDATEKALLFVQFCLAVALGVFIWPSGYLPWPAAPTDSVGPLSLAQAVAEWNATQWNGTATIVYPTESGAPPPYWIVTDHQRDTPLETTTVPTDLMFCDTELVTTAWITSILLIIVGVFVCGGLTIEYLEEEEKKSKAATADKVPSSEASSPQVEIEIKTSDK